MCAFSKPKRHSADFIVCLNADKSQNSENEYRDKRLKIKVHRSVSFQEGSKFENAVLRCTLKVRNLLKWLTHVGFSFLTRSSDSIWYKNDLITASNGSVVEANRLEYLTSSRSTQTFPVCTENPVDNVNRVQRTIKEDKQRKLILNFVFETYR